MKTPENLLFVNKICDNFCEVRDLNYVIAFMLTASTVYGAASGNGGEVASALTDSAFEAAELGMTLAAVMAFWGGMMRVAEKCCIVDKVCQIIRPVVRILMPDISDRGTLDAVSMNVTANLLGMGNAATPLGIKAMKRLAAGKTCGRSMAVFILLNTASVQLLPTTVIALRSSAGSAAPSDCVLPVLVNSAAALAFGLAAVYILYGGGKCRSLRWQHRYSQL